MILSLAKVLVSNAMFSLVSLLFLFHFLLVHLEVGIKKAEGSYDENNEKVNNFEGHISLHVKAVPVSGGGTLFGGGICFNGSDNGISYFKDIGLVLLDHFEGLGNLLILERVWVDLSLDDPFGRRVNLTSCLNNLSSVGIKFPLEKGISLGVLSF